MSSLCDTATTCSELANHPDAHELVLPTVPTYQVHLTRGRISDDPDLKPAVRIDGLGKNQSTISRAIDKSRAEYFWPSTLVADSLTLTETDWGLLAHQRSLATTGAMCFLTSLPSHLWASMRICGGRNSVFFLLEPLFAATACASCSETMDVFGHHALAGWARSFSRLHRHHKLTQTVHRWILAPARIPAKFEKISFQARISFFPRRASTKTTLTSPSTLSMSQCATWWAAQQSPKSSVQQQRLVLSWPTSSKPRDRSIVSRPSVALWLTPFGSATLPFTRWAST